MDVPYNLPRSQDIEKTRHLSIIILKVEGKVGQFNAKENMLYAS